MDFKTYITKVEDQLNQMSEKQKTEWIFNQARTVEEKDREKFLNRLSGRIDVYAEEGLTKDKLKNWFRQVDEGEIYFGMEEYEQYNEGEWIWDPDWVTEYYDIFDIIPMLIKVIRLSHQLMLQREYRDSFDILDRVYRIEFYADSEYGDAERISLMELAEEKLINLNFRKISLNLLYSCYQVHSGQSRIRKIYEYLTWDECADIKVTDIFSFGPDPIEDADDFMKEWKDFLMHTPGNRAAKLLIDACIYLGGEGELLQTAEENCETHPLLYLECCERKYQNYNYEGCITAAEKALKQIDREKRIRGDIADIAVKAIENIKDERLLSYFYREAFFSDPTSRHLLALFRLNDHKITDWALQRVRGLKIDSDTWRRYSNWSAPADEQKEASINNQEKKIIYRFMLGDYRSIIEKCMNDSVYLGWTSDIKGAIVPLLLLYLKKDEETKTIAEQSVLSDMKYRMGFAGSEGETFSDYIRAWRMSENIPEEKKEKYIQWLKKEIDRRTEHVVGGGYRKSYFKAAKLVVLLGEILEERGEADGMRKLIEYYKKKHTRKRAFKSEIEELAQRGISSESC